MNKNETEDWDLILKPQRSLLSVDLREIWRYRDLLSMFVKRDIITVYKQTILGPLWYLIQPVLTTIIYMFVFGHVAGLSTDGAPQILFYLAGITIWNFFSDSFSTTSRTFMENAQIFGKVYFPRLIMPLSKVISAMIKFCIQMLVFLAVFTFYLVFTENKISPNITILMVPVYVLLMSLMGLGFGIIFTSLTVKYRDLNFLLQFGVQLLMFISPVIYPLSSIPEKFRWVIQYNPLSPVLEGFKYAFLGSGSIDVFMILYSFIFSIIVFIIGMLIFNKTERNFIDIV